MKHLLALTSYYAFIYPLMALSVLITDGDAFYRSGEDHDVEPAE